jgi:asparaginyl-tRNA synthetase
VGRYACGLSEGARVYPSIRSILGSAQVGGSVAVAGWVRSARHGKDLSFVDLSDGSGLAGLQVVAEAGLACYERHVAPLRTGCAIVARGTLVESQGAGQRVELKAAEIELVGDVSDEYPLQKKRQSFEFLRTVGHLRFRTNTLGAVLRLRSAASAAIHRFFESRDFYYLHSPVITVTDCEGAGQLFRVTTLDPVQPAAAPAAANWEDDFFKEPAYLTVSGQLEAEIAALAHSRVYTFGPTFRAENSNTTRHLAEFWMIEPEAAFCELPELIELVEAFIKSVLSDVLQECASDLELFDQRIAPGILERHRQLLDTPFARLTYTECIALLEKADRKFEFPVFWGCDLQSEHERYLCEEYAKRPVVVTDYPAKNKAFYMYRNADGKTVGAMDVLVPAIGEIVGGSQREHRLDRLIEQMDLHGVSQERYAWYLDLRRYGSVPHSGFGMGFERFIRFLTGLDNVRDVVPFPRVPGSALF